MASNIEGQVKAIVAKLAKVPAGKISSTADMRKLGIDSLMALEVVANLERAFKIHVPEGKIRGVVRVDQIVKLVDELRSPGQKRPSSARDSRKITRRGRTPAKV